MKRVLVTGSSGYIGRHLVNKIRNTFNVSGLDIVPCDDVFLHNIDIRNNFSLDIEYDTVIHLAALANVGESTTIPTDYFDTNVNGTINLLRNIKYKNFVFASTGAAVGMASPYAVSKRMAEYVVEDYCKKNDKTFTIFRFYNVTGTKGYPPTNPDGLFLSLLRAKETGIFYIYGGDYNTIDGTAVRDYIHVDEVCESLKLAINDPANNLENLGHGIGTSVRQMVDLFKQVNNCDFKVEMRDRRPGDLEVSVLDNVSRYMREKYIMEEILKYDRGY